MESNPPPITPDLDYFPKVERLPAQHQAFGKIIYQLESLAQYKNA